ncbi:MAG: lipoate--protein ligase family protein, partial [Firmicutes bacterium]|nr:lipoate--protein ligase family protein [Bacillota bacterium]
KNRILHHGTLLFASLEDKISGALNVSEEKIRSKGIKSVKSRVTDISSHLSSPLTSEEFIGKLGEFVIKTDASCKEYDLSTDFTGIEKLMHEKYETWEWNYGRAKPCTMVREEKFPAGLVSVHLEAENGKISSIQFYGDFFGNGEISQLEENLTGMALDENLEQKLRELNLGYYMNGIDAGELSRLIRG